METVSAWLDWLEVDRGLSPNTVRSYTRTLRTLPDAETATREDVEAWWRSRAHLTPGTRVTDLAAVRAYYRWMVRFEHRPDDPTVRIDAPRLPRGLPRPVSRDELLRLLAALDGDLRRAVVLGAYGGLRVSEAASADWSDLDLENARLRVTGKGRKVRLVATGPAMLDGILPNVGGNIVTAGGQPYTASALQRKVNRAIRAAGVDATFHQLRHRFGSVAVSSGVPLLSVSRAMGHASPTTTAIYAATSDADLDVIAEAVAR